MTGQVKAKFLELVQSETDECVLWNHKISNNGYAGIRHEGRSLGAHVVALTIRSGPKPEPKMVAAHRCRNRNCINYRHLRWATATENAADKVRDGVALFGERNHNAKLTADEVRAIRELAPRASKQSLAEMYGISPITVRDIINGRTWRHVA